MFGSASKTFGFGIVLNAVNRASGPIKEANKDFTKLEESFRRGKSSFKDVLSAGYFNKELKSIGAGIAVLGASFKLAADAAPIELAKRNLMTLGFTARESGNMLQAAFDISKRPNILVGWKELQDSAYDIKSALGGIGSSSTVTTALETVALLASGSPEADSVEDIKSSWVAFFQGYGKYSSDIKSDSKRFADVVTATNMEFNTTNKQIASTFSQTAISLANNNQELETAVALVGALNETMGGRAAPAMRALFDELTSSYTKIKRAGVDLAPGGVFLQFPEMIRQMKNVIPELGEARMSVSSRDRLSSEFGLSGSAVEALINGASMLGKINTVIGSDSLSGTSDRTATTRVKGTYQKALSDLNTEVDQLKLELGESVIPSLTTVVKISGKGVGITRDINKELNKSNITLATIAMILAGPGIVGFLSKLLTLTGVGGGYAKVLPILKAVGLTGGTMLTIGVVGQQLLERQEASTNPYGLSTRRIAEIAHMTDASGRKEYVEGAAIDSWIEREIVDITDQQKKAIAKELSELTGKDVSYDYYKSVREGYIKKTVGTAANTIYNPMMEAILSTVSPGAGDIYRNNTYDAMLKPMLDVASRDAATMSMSGNTFRSGDLIINVLPRAGESDEELAERIALLAEKKKLEQMEGDNESIFDSITDGWQKLLKRYGVN